VAGFSFEEAQDHGQAESLTEKPVDNSQLYYILISYACFSRPQLSAHTV
jgi:hypothetical protein